jgi:hypothetical protein
VQQARSLQEVTAVPSTPVVVDQEELKYKALQIIVLTVSDSLLPQIMAIIDPIIVWIKLRDLYESKRMNKKLTLKQQFHSLKMTEKTTVDEHLRNINILTSQLTNIGVVILDE